MKKSRTPGLYEHKNGVFYLRRQIPLPLRAFFGGKAEWKESLGVRDYGTAKALFAAADAKLQARLKIARETVGSPDNKIDEEKAAQLVAQFLLGPANDSTLADKAERRAAFALASIANLIDEEYRQALEERLVHDPDERSAMPFPDPIERLRDDLHRGRIERVLPLMEEFLAFSKLDHPNRRDERILAEALLQRLVDPEVHARKAFSIDRTLEQLLPSKKHRDGRVSDVLAYWKTIRSGARKQTVVEYELAVDRFISLFGDLPAKDVTPDLGQAYANAIELLPSPLSAAERAQPFRDLVAHLLRHGRGDRAKLAPASVKKFTGGMSAIFAAAEKAFGLAGNPFAKIKVTGQKNGKVRVQQPRRPFTEEMMTKIFCSPMFTGCKGARIAQRAKAGDLILQDNIYWLFLLAAATGARIEELGQLLVADVRQEHGIWVLTLDDLGEEQEVKTDSSRRRVPLHPKLLALGFIDWAVKGRSAGDMVFRGLTLNTVDKWTNGLSRQANNYLDRIGISDPAYVFYSFRHRFKDECRDADIEKSVHDQFTGHAKPDVGSRYGDGAGLKKLHREMCKLPLAYFPTGPIYRTI